MDNLQHPEWCDARFCSDWPSNREHLGLPSVLNPDDDDVTVAVAASRLDEIGVFEIAGREHVQLELRDLVSVTPGGDALRVAVDLTAAEARMLAAALVERAELLETRKVTIPR